MSGQSAVHELPAFLNGVCTPKAYRHWLSRKAKSHVTRDRKRGNLTATNAEYKQAIHQAVLSNGDRDFYTGFPLRWDQISRYSNSEAKKRGRAYKKEFGDLPTVDHVTDGLGPADFVICSWRVNDSKNDLDINEFLEVCQAVLAHSGQSEGAEIAPDLALQRTPAAAAPSVLSSIISADGSADPGG